jgi:N-acetyl-anhydromuramyl-L-alanine amidase AmpD
MNIEPDQKAALGGADAVQACPKKAVLTITVRTAFYNPAQGECYGIAEGVGGVTFKIDGAAAKGKRPKTQVTAVTSGVAMEVPLSTHLPSKVTKPAAKSREVGLAELSIEDLADGEHTLELVPPPGQDSTTPADPAMTDPGAKKQRFRAVHVRFKLAGCRITEAPVIFDPADPKATINHAYIGAFRDTAIAVDWKPDWAWSVFQRGARSKTLDLIVIHHTDGAIISGAYNMRTNDGEPFGAHYEIDLDGHVVKYGVDSQRVNHAAPARWGGVESVNGFAIGIETVHHEGQFTDAQYASMLKLLDQLVTANGIPKHRIIGHSDCDVSDGDHWLMGEHRENDPSPEFEWTRIEAVGLGMIPIAETPRNEGWAAYFAKYTESLRRKDKDADKTWGAVARKDEAMTGVIEGLQEALIKIGYSVPRASGKFDNYTVEAVKGFKRHFFTGTRDKLFPGQKSQALAWVDADTAWHIQAVAAGIP